jgi:hypothetical protein
VLGARLSTNIGKQVLPSKGHTQLVHQFFARQLITPFLKYGSGCPYCVGQAGRKLEGNCAKS